MKIKQSQGYRIFFVVNLVFLLLLALICILPFIHILAVSLSDKVSTTANAVALWPKGFNIQSYVKAFADKNIWSSLWVTLQRMVLGTLYSMFLTVTVAYPLSFDSKNFRGRKIYVAFFFISMLFSGGIIPYYILIRNLNLMDTIWALVLGPVPVGSVIILMNFYRQLPKALFESARIDGASHFRILAKIYLPLSMPSIATLSLMSLVGHWNEWFGGMIYMKDVANYPLQTYLYASMQNVSEFVSLQGAGASVSRQGLIAAQTIFTILPILFAFPVLQKYIKTGLVLGSVKE
mgnify:CR=1 FL=1